MSKRYWTTVAAVAVAAGVAGMYLARNMESPAVQLVSGTAFPQPVALAPFDLVDAHGAAVTPESLRGQPTLVFFGFTHCPDVCPTTLALLANAQKQVAQKDPALAALKIALITVDPERDTPEQMGKYVSSFGGDLIGLTGAPPEIVKAQKTFGVASARVDLAGGSYTMDHSSTVFVLDSMARKVAVFTAPLNSKLLPEDLVRLAPLLVTP